MHLNNWLTKAGIGHPLGSVGTIISNPMHRVPDQRERRAIWAAKYAMQYNGTHPKNPFVISCLRGCQIDRGNIERSGTG